MIEVGSNPARAYSSQDLHALVDSDSWRSLQPNYPAYTDLLPAHLSVRDVEELADTALELTHTLQTNGLLDHAEGHVLAEVANGTLSLAGAGESKACYRLQHEAGTLAVQVLGFGENLPPHTPSSAHFTKIKQDPLLNLWEYSDPRPYLVLPFTDNLAVRLQEDGGSPFTQSPRSIVPGLRWLSTQRALGIIKTEKSLDARDIETTQAEMSGAHFLSKAGFILPLLVDVPVIERSLNKHL